MAKQKKEKLYCDQMAECNMELIRTLGKVADENEVYAAVANDFAHQALSKDVPFDKVESLVKEQMDKTETMSQMAGLAALNNWFWGGRQVYRFDKDLAGLLYSQTKNDVEVDCAMLELLPCSHFYISLEDEIRKGFFVSYCNDVLYISDMGNSFTLSLGIVIPKSETLISEIIEESNLRIGNNITKKQTNELANRISVYMQFIVYLSAINAEIEPVTQGSIVIRQAGKKATTKHDKTEIGNVGYRIGEVLRTNKKEKANVKYIGEHSQGSPKSPHIRRSHFHSYWTGSANDRKLIVKWVNTIFVHGDNNSSTSTVHDVKK